LITDYRFSLFSSRLIFTEIDYLSAFIYDTLGGIKRPGRTGCFFLFGQAGCQLIAEGEAAASHSKASRRQLPADSQTNSASTPQAAGFQPAGDTSSLPPFTPPAADMIRRPASRQQPP
jgi:hypothetical protein